MKLNAKRGLNRIFVVLTAVWAIYCMLGYPFQRRLEAVRKWNANMTDCYKAPHDEQKDCYAAVQQIYLNEVGQYQMPDYYKWSWPFLLIAVIGLPLVVYASCNSIIAMVVWVRKGFTE